MVFCSATTEIFYAKFLIEYVPSLTEKAKMFSFEKKISKKKFTLLLILNFPPSLTEFLAKKNYKIVAAFCVLSSPFFLQNKESIFANDCIKNL